MKVYGKTEVYVDVFLTSPLYGGSGEIYALPLDFRREKEHRYPN
jgi:hypothetical protein